MGWVKAILMIAAALAVGLVAPETVFAQWCSGCKAAMGASPEAQQMAGAFNSSILFLLSAPYMVLGTVALLIFKARRR
ncbi:MAG: hypothetical protein HY652_00785 [Acidobacteria bacterium]|nr:hypothetical protein [Acidobacteriota bacterium]